MNKTDLTGDRLLKNTIPDKWMEIFQKNKFCLFFLISVFTISCCPEVLLLPEKDQ